MTLRQFSIGLAAATVTLSLSPAWAQERGRPADSHTTGSAVPRGSDSGSSSSSSNSGSGSGSTSSSSPSSSGGWMDNSSQRAEAPRAPVHPDRAEAADQRRSNGANSGRAVPRSESGGNSGGASGTNASSAPAGGRSGDRSSTAVPTYSRPRGDKNATGTAVPRTGPIPGDDHNHGYYPYYPGYIYDPYYSFYYDPFYYSRYGYWAPYGYGYGLGYFSYDPFLFGAMGYAGSYSGSDPYYSGGGGTGGGSTGSSSSQFYPGSGSLRLKIKPRNAEVFIDGLSVGVIDSFDGVFQRLDVQAGPHKIELRAAGYQTEQFDVIITSGETVTYKGDMKRR